MGECAICKKGLRILEGYSEGDNNYCDDCYHKKDIMPISKIKKLRGSKNMDKEQRAQIKRIIDMGMWNFVLTRGLLLWGGLMFVIMTFFQWLSMGEYFDSSVIVFGIILWGVAGLIFGFVTWYLANKKYKEK